MFSDSLQVAVGDLDPGAASFPIHVLDPFFCKPYNHLRLVEDVDDDRLTCATSPQSTWRAWKGFWASCRLLKGAPPCNPLTVEAGNNDQKGFMTIFISGTAGTSPFSWPCCQKTEGAKLSQGDQNGFADGRWSIEASPLPLLPSPCFVPGGGNPCLHPGHPLLGTSPRRRSG